MTEAEVEEIFGVPEGRYDGAAPDKLMLLSFPEEWEEKVDSNQLAFSGKTIFISARHGPNPYVKSWSSRHGVFHVAFDNQGRVAATGIWGDSKVEPWWRRWWRRLAGK
jgi:hypothetical protein